MTKFPGLAIGLAAFLAAGPAGAATIYDTIDDYSATGGFKLGAIINSGLAHDPMGDEFNVASASAISSVTVALADSLGSGSTNDGGTVLVYLVADNNGLPATSSGITLSPATLLGTISDSQLVSGGGITNVTVSGSSAAVTPGNYWLELTSGADPNNGDNNLNQTTAEWAYFADSSLSGPTVGSISSFVIQAASSFDTSAGPNPDTGFDNVFEAQVNTPEPASLGLLGAGVAGLGFARSRRVAKSAR